jgi:hypothetical protein
MNKVKECIVSDLVDTGCLPQQGVSFRGYEGHIVIATQMPANSPILWLPFDHISVKRTSRADLDAVAGTGG